MAVDRQVLYIGTGINELYCVAPVYYSALFCSPKTSPFVTGDRVVFIEKRKKKKCSGLEGVFISLKLVKINWAPCWLLNLPAPDKRC